MSDGQDSFKSSKWIVALACTASVLIGWVCGYQHKKSNYKGKFAKAQVVHEQQVAQLNQQVAQLSAKAHSVVENPNTLLQRDKVKKDLLDIKLLVEKLEPRLRGESSKLRIAQILRNFVYTRIARRATDPSVRITSDHDWEDFAGTFRKAILDPTYGHSCGGRSIVYLYALRAFGIAARKVGVFPEASNINTSIATSHASVDVLIDGTWVAQDPTFNFSLVDSAGRGIGWMDAAVANSVGHEVKHRSDGFEVIPLYSIEKYVQGNGVRLQDYLKFANSGPYWDGLKTVEGTKFPKEWDGNMSFLDGRQIKTFENNSSGVYKLLAQSLE